MTNKKLLAAGVACLFLAVALLVNLSLPTLGERVVTFASTYGDKPVTLEASYWPVEGAEYAVLICPGYSCDRQKWRPMADLCVASGYTTMTFDYSGQGASAGVIGFDNAKTDNIPAEISDAMTKLRELSGVDNAHIILLGHSMGGRSILRLMYDWNAPDAVTRVPKDPAANVILISPEVNYHFNAQASLFAGTSDDAEEPWHSFGLQWTAGTDVYLFGSTADDIVSDEDILAIYAHLGGGAVPESGEWSAVQTNAVGSKLSVAITDGVLHSYQMYSPKFAAFVSHALGTISGRPGDYQPWKMAQVYAGWALALAGVWMTLAALNSGSWQPADAVPRLTDTGRFLRHKALMWLPGTLAALLICCLCVAMPFGSPVMNIPYMCFIAGYGVVMLLAYRKGRFAGTEGRLPRLTLRVSGGGRGIAVCAAVTAAICLAVWFVLRATMYRLIPLNARLFWVLLAAVLMAAGYYVSGCENDMMDQAGVHGWSRFLYNVITYVPLFLLVLFYLVLKSYSGLIGQVQNMVLMYVLCIPLGDFVRRRTSSRLWGAVVSAFLFQTLMITSAALISMF